MDLDFLKLLRPAVWRAAGTTEDGRVAQKRAARKLSMIFTGLALLVPVLTGILNQVPDSTKGTWTIDRTTLLDIGPTHMRAIGGTFTWRFFEWQIFGSNDVPIGSGGGVFNFINVLNPTLFHVFFLLIVVALIAQRRSVRA